MVNSKNHKTKRRAFDILQLKDLFRKISVNFMQL